MASVIKDPGGRKRIQFTDPGGKRRALRLGKVSQKAAEAIRVHVEALLAARITGQPPERAAALWLAEVGDGLYERLVKAGLAAPRLEQAPVPTVEGLVSGYLAARKDIKPGTRVNLELAGRNLVAFLGASQRIDRVTEADASAFLQELATVQELAANTARRRAGRARQFFGWAVRSRWLERNPFDGLAVRTRGNPARQQYVPAGDVLAVMERATSAEWRLMLALCRWAGLRCPSEHLALRWGDVDLEAGRLTVRSPKLEHIEGKGERTVPLFPELRPHLEAVLAEQEPNAEFVFNQLRRGPGQSARQVNWSTRVLAFVRRAGLEPWPRLFNALRSSCETDLCERFPTHVVCAWLGNSPAVAKEHYLVVTDDHFRRALEPAPEEVARNAARTAAEESGQEGTGRAKKHPGPAESQGIPAIAGPGEAYQMTPGGLEEAQVSSPHLPHSTDGGAICGAFFHFLELLASDPALMEQVPPQMRGRVRMFQAVVEQGGS